MYQKNVVLCACSSYERKFYFNEDFSGLPKAVKDELKIMCVLYTAEAGGILTLEFDDSGKLFLQVTQDEGDILFDEISSGLKIKEIQQNKQELLESLELYYRTFFMGADVLKGGEV